MEDQVKLGCDNSKSVCHGKGDWHKVSLSTAHTDLIRANRVNKHNLPVFRKL
jgi:hypothetical protein